ncbi:alpha/beta hydrolase [Amycolatopsis bartoniae]|uniref:Putative hydrolase (Alpha/beta fold) n=1 Tax=Amycolatopsis bartoniae TaxID=941986 RepID=A0A8H9INI5_9PSEU|nr:alpha/beta hydrolase [Amycolatopsis bartoniae]TVT08343.1 alpha/beta hydrolase [Amycolatopsis bartoniae]GHF36005.1 putative hydrolase (alpha/beta fold) [Amycolatopsis bartoniae]
MTTTVAKLDGADGQTLVADVIEPGAADSSGPTVLFLHGGGQTRGSWRATATRIAGEGWRTVSVDQRGHGESPWRPDGRYDNGDYAADLIAVARRWPRPVVVGASLGGLAGLLAVGELGLDVRGLVLVDVAVSNRVDGSDQIRGFMTAHPDGFADLDEAADAVAAYLPGRRRPRSVDGLRRNLRRHEDGRYHWHWDPRFLDHDRGRGEAARERLANAARRITAPVLLVRGGRSELVDDHAVSELLALIPHARVSVVDKAHHMVAGDDNETFGREVVRFVRATEDSDSQ